MEKEIIEGIMETIPSIRAIYLFGSFAKGQSTSSSDVDIAIFSETRLNASLIFNTAQELAVRLNRDVDLLDMEQVPLVMQFQIISTGKVIYAKDPLTLLEFEVRIISMYQRFNEERKDILNEIIQSGKVLS